jgi:hypothetical protein
VVFDIKLHIDVDSKTELIHAMTTTAANVHDTNVLRQLLHGDETRIYWGQAYRGQIAVIREHAPGARDFTSPTGTIAIVALSTWPRLAVADWRRTSISCGRRAISPICS